MIIEAYSTVWFCGLAASGRTTCLRWVSEFFPRALYLNDSQEIINFIRNDTETRHHIRPTPDSFILTSSVPVEYAMRELIAKAKDSNRTNIIELSRGRDRQGKIDFSFQALLTALPAELKAHSLFIYVWAPLADRLRRNELRPGLSTKITAFESFQCPPEAFERFFMDDDFDKAVSQYPVDHLFLTNMSSGEDFHRKINYLFSPRKFG